MSAILMVSELKGKQLEIPVGRLADVAPTILKLMGLT